MAEGASRQSATVLERLDAHLPARLLGFGLLYAWGICLWDIPLPASAHANALQTDPAWFLSALLTPLACLVITLIGRQRELSSLPGVTVAAPLLCSIGSIALIGCGYTSGWVHGLCTLVAGMGTGLGPAFLVILWGCLFARISTSIVETMIPASFVATLLGALVVPELPPLPAGLIVTLLPIASGLLLALSRRSLDMGAIPPEDSADIKPLTVGPFTVLRMVAAVFVLYTLGCAAPAMSSVSLSATIDAYATVIGMLFAVALSVCIVLFSHRVNVAALYRWITVPFVVGLVIIPLSSETAAFIARVLPNTVFTGIEIISMLYFIRLSQRTALSTSFYVGLGAGAAYGGVFVGYGMMGALQELAADTTSATFGCLVMLGLFSLTSLLVPRHDATLEGSAAPDAEAGPKEAGEGAPVATSYASEVDAVIEHRSAVAKSFGLSARETEIFLLLAQGRSRPYIRDSLYLSKNTVATHIRHIYEKLGIHSQQELIDLVER